MHNTWGENGLSFGFMQLKEKTQPWSGVAPKLRAAGSFIQSLIQQNFIGLLLCFKLYFGAPRTEKQNDRIGKSVLNAFQPV